MNKTQKMLERLIHRLAVTLRVGVENEDFTLEDGMDFIREEAEKEFNRIMSMSRRELAIMAMSEIVHSLAEEQKER